jgi:hypothetical protein
MSRVIAFVVLAFIASVAGAHAFLDHASPRVGSTVNAAPGEVALWFSQDLEPAFSTVRVLDKDGKEVDRQDKRIDPSDRSVMRVSLPPLGPGTYKVQWRVLSADTHVTEGDFTFTVKP